VAVYAHFIPTDDDDDDVRDDNVCIIIVTRCRILCFFLAFFVFSVQLLRVNRGEITAFNSS